jgi:hypothetical protein
MYHNPLLEFITYNDYLTLLLLLIPWAIGISVVLAVLIEKYWSWVWKGMEEEARYFYVKFSKW